MYKAENLKYLEDLLFTRKALAQDIDVSNVISMNCLFENKTENSFKGYISDWDVSNVRNMSWMFSCSEFNCDISNWNVHSVTDMFYIFSGSIFNGDISNWNIQSLKTRLEEVFINSKLEIPETWKIQKLLVG